MVPDLCELEVDRRTLPGETQESVYAELRARLDPLAGEDPGFRYELTKPSWLIPANDVPLTQPVVGALLQAYGRVLGRPTQATAFPAGSDAPHLGCPTVVCGPGSIAQAHTTDEFVAAQEIVAATRMYLHVVVQLLT
jgi:acetylornithine deacetylase